MPRVCFSPVGMFINANNPFYSVNPSDLAANLSSKSLSPEPSGEDQTNNIKGLTSSFCALQSYEKYVEKIVNAIESNI